VGLDWGQLSLVSTIDELFGRNSSGSGLEIREHGRRDSLRRPRGTLYPQKLALSTPTSGGRYSFSRGLSPWSLFCKLTDVSEESTPSVFSAGDYVRTE
jgi:hypothetical protein